MNKRIDKDSENLCDNQLRCLGIDILSDEIIEMAGINGGGLLTSTSQGDSIDIVAPDWPIYDIIFCPQYSSIYIDRTKDKCHIIASEYEIRACGFSWNGNFLVYAISSGFVLCKRVTCC